MAPGVVWFVNPPWTTAQAVPNSQENIQLFKNNGYHGPYNSKAAAFKAIEQHRQGHKPKPKKKSHQVSGAAIVAAARTWLGVPYLYGGDTRRGIDCSGLVQQVAFSVGIQSCPRTSEEQWAWSRHISESEAGAGDLVFFVGAEIDPPPGHVGIMVAKGRMINAETTGTNVMYASFPPDGGGFGQLIGYGRMQGATGSPTANNNYQSGQNTGVVATEAASGVAVTGVMIALFILVAILLIGGGLLFKGVNG